MSKVLVDTVLYNPCIEVLEVNKDSKEVKVRDLFNNGIERTLKLHQSKSNSYHYYFKMNRHSFWLHSLYEKEVK